MPKIGKIILPPTPAPGVSPSEVSNNTASWARQAEQAVRKISGAVDGRAALYVYTSVGDINGFVIGSVGDECNQIYGGALVKKWTKTSGSETNQGWV